MPAAVPLNALKRHVAPMRDDLLAVAAATIDEGRYILGPGVAAFERAFADYCGVAHCLGTGNGTDALELALKAVGVAAGDAVAVTANAAMYATTAVLACGATPVFVDVCDDDATLDADALDRVFDGEARIEKARIKAVVATHLYGRLARMDTLLGLCRPRGIAVVEDCAQAHGARGRDGKRAGAYGDAAAFSFYPTKNLGALGDGGAVVTDDDAVAERVRALRQYGWERKYVNALPGGRNSRLDELQARMLSLMLPRLEGWNARRRAIAARYTRGIDHPDIRVAPEGGDDYVAHLYVVHSERRDALRAHLAGAGVETDVHFPVPDHRQPCHGGRYDAVSLPVTERHTRTALTLPCFPELTDDEATLVIDACNRF